MGAPTHHADGEFTLVTGSTGFVGGAVCRALLAEGEQVVAMVRGTRDVPGTQAWRVDDLCQLPPDKSVVLQQVACVVHCAARVHQLGDQASNPLAEFRRVNTEATLTLARRAAAAGVKRFVFISSIGVNGSHTRRGAFRHDDTPAPDSPYAQSKWEAEQGLMALAASTGMQVVIIRPPMIYGPQAPGNFALLVKLVRKGWPLPLGSLHAPRSFVALDNVVSLITTAVRAASIPSGVYLVSDPSATTTTAFIRQIARGLGLPPRLWPVPLPLLQALAACAGRSAQLRKMAVPLALDISATCERLDWQPPLTLETALQRALASPDRQV